MNNSNVYSNADRLLEDISKSPKDLIHQYMVKHKQPKYLYKYHSSINPKFVENIVCDFTLWLSDIKDLNDPFEFNWTTYESSK